MRPPFRSLRRYLRARHVGRRLEPVMARPTWDQTWLEMARVMARRSLCERDQVGTIIVDPANRIIASSYNGVPAGHPGEGPCSGYCTRGRVGPTPTTTVSYVDCPALHSEANALVVCDRSMRVGGTIYVTSDVCWACSKLIANSGLARVVVPRDDQHVHRNSGESYEFLRMCGLEVSFVG